MYFDRVKISELPEVYSIVNRDYLVVNVDDKQSSKLSFQNFTDAFTSQNLVWTGNIVFTGQVVLPPEAETDPIFVGSPAFTITDDDIARWNEAHSWGDHALEGYLKSQDIPTGFLMPGDNVSLLFNDPPYVTKAELDDAIDNLEIITIEEIENILDTGEYLKKGDPVSYLVNDVPYLTESALLCILNGNTSACHPDPNSRGYLKRAVDGIPQDNVSELFNDVPYLTESDFNNAAQMFLRRRDPITGDFNDPVSELENDVGYLLHEWDGEPLTGYDIEILSNVIADDAYDGEVLVKEGDSWVNKDQSANLGNLRFIGKVDVSFTNSGHEPGDILVQHKDNGNVAYPHVSWDIINLDDTGTVENHTWMVVLQDGSVVLLGKWNDQLQSDWLTSDTWHPSFIRNKPTKLSDIDPGVPDVIGDGKIEVSAGDGIQVTGAGGTANQTADTNQVISINLKTDGGIIIDGGQIEIDWAGNVGDGDINLIAGEGIEVRHLQVEEPHANQYCDTDTVIELNRIYRDRINTLESQVADLITRVQKLEKP